MTAPTTRAPAADGPARPRARRGEGDKLRAEILAAAERLLLASGSEEAVSIRRIAREVGVTPPSIYRHFLDKESLIFEVCERVFGVFDSVIESAGATTLEPVESLRRRAVAYVRFGRDNPEQYRILFMRRSSVTPTTNLAEMPGAVAFNHLVEAVRRGIDAGALRRDLDAFVAATGLWAGVHGITSLLISLPSFPWPDVDTLVEHLYESLMYGLTEPKESR